MTNKATLSGQDETYRFYYSEAADDRERAFAAARLRKTNEPDATVVVSARDANEGYRVYLDNELQPRLERL